HTTPREWAGHGEGAWGPRELADTMAMLLSSHTTAGAGRLVTLLRSQPSRRQEVCEPVPTGALDAIGLQTRLRLGPIQQVRGLVRCPRLTRAKATQALSLVLPACSAGLVRSPWEHTAEIRYR